jgi:hypothetical protein
MRTIAIILGLCGVAIAQGQAPPSTVNNLPPAAANATKAFQVTDGIAPGRCDVGGGTSKTICVSDGTAWQPPQTALIPSGLITITLTTCPAGWTEATELNGVTLQGTLTTNGNVGTTGGADSVTPAGTNSAPTFTGTPFTSVINHTHAVTVTYNVQGNTTAATTGTHVMTSTATGGSARAPTSGDVVSATTANPSGGVSSITPAGTVTAPVFTGNSFDNRSAFVRVIFCKKN